MTELWISTGEANRIFNCGISDCTFRNKMRGIIRSRLTPGGNIRWFKPDVEAAANPREYSTKGGV